MKKWIIRCVPAFGAVMAGVGMILAVLGGWGIESVCRYAGYLIWNAGCTFIVWANT